MEMYNEIGSEGVAKNYSKNKNISHKEYWEY